MAVFYDGAGGSFTVASSDFRGRGWLDQVAALGVSDERLLATLEAAQIHNANTARGVSTTSLSIGTGSKSLTATPLRNWVVSQRLRVEDSGNSANFMLGHVTSYNVSTGALDISVDEAGGSGTISDWVVSPAYPVDFNFSAIGSLSVVSASSSAAGTVLSIAGPLRLYGALFKGNSEFSVSVSGGTSGSILSVNAFEPPDSGGDISTTVVLPPAVYGTSGETVTVETAGSSLSVGYMLWHL